MYVIRKIFITAVIVFQGTNIYKQIAKTCI